MTDFQETSKDTLVSSEDLKKTAEPVIENCPECLKNDLEISNETGYVVCTNCGVVISNIISDSAEWNNYNGPDKSRCGPIESLNPFSGALNTFVPKGSNSYILKDNLYIKCDIYKLHIQNSYNNLQKSYDQTSSQIDNIQIQDIIKDTAKKMWSIVMKSGIVIRSGPRKGLLACCLYYASLYHGIPRSPIEISNIFNMSDTKNFNKGLKEYRSIFEQNQDYRHLLVQSSVATDYFTRFCTALKTSKLIQNFN